MTDNPTPNDIALLREAREAAALVFDARAKKFGASVATITMDRHHAKVIRQGEGDDYDAVQSALIALRRAALAPGQHDGAAGEGLDRQRLALRAIKAVTATTKDGAKGLSRIMSIAHSAGVEEQYTELLADPDVALIVERPRTEWAHLFRPGVEGCAIPPTGWKCTRARGHSGPCAAKPAPTEQARVEEIERLREHISEQITHAETRIADGIEMGAVVWRIALEDIIRENRAMLAAASDDAVGGGDE